MAKKEQILIIRTAIELPAVNTEVKNTLLLLLPPLESVRVRVVQKGTVSVPPLDERRLVEAIANIIILFESAKWRNGRAILRHAARYVALQPYPSA